MKFPLVEIDEVGNTRDRILLVAAKMFSTRGYAAVSMREIADSVNIKAASIYNYFENKEALFDAIVDTIKDVYLDFYNRVDKEIESATSFAEVLEALCGELKEVYHMFIFYGVALIATEQFRSEKARHVFNDIYMKIGIEYSEKLFRGCIEKKWVEEFDTEALAIMFMNSIFAGSLVRVHEDLDQKAAYNSTEMFTRIQMFMLSAVKLIGQN